MAHSSAAVLSCALPSHSARKHLSVSQGRRFKSLNSGTPLAEVARSQDAFGPVLASRSVKSPSFEQTRLSITCEVRCACCPPSLATQAVSPSSRHYGAPPRPLGRCGSSAARI